MRQVPLYLLIGNGRVARHFQHYLSLLKLPFLTWQRQESIAQLHTQLNQATHVLLLINDPAIEAFVTEHLTSNPALHIHFSGSLNTPFAHGAHPLMTFTHHLYDLEKYQSIPFVVDEEAPEFSVLLPGFPNPHYRLNKALKSKYHALCVLSGNFSCMLWQKMIATFAQEFNFPASMIHPYLVQQMQNLLLDPQSALTGPLVRGDQKTIDKNLLALQSDPFQQVYQSFVSCFQQIKKEEKRG